MLELHIEIAKTDNERSRKSDFSRLHILDEYLEKDMDRNLRENFFAEYIKKDIRLLEYYQALNHERSFRGADRTPYDNDVYDQIIKTNKHRIDLLEDKCLIEIQSRMNNEVEKKKGVLVSIFQFFKKG